MKNSINKNQEMGGNRQRLLSNPLSMPALACAKSRWLFFAVILSALLTLSACSVAGTQTPVTGSDPDTDSAQVADDTDENATSADADDPEPKESDTAAPEQDEGNMSADLSDPVSQDETDEDRMDFDQTATGEYRTISPADAKAWLDSEDPPLLLDVRTHEENLSVRIPRSFLIPIDDLEREIDRIPADKDEPIIIYCRSGNRSAVAARILLEAGFTNVYDLGGIMSWPYLTTFG